MTDRDLRDLFNQIAELSKASDEQVQLFRKLFHKVQEDAVVYQGFWEDLRDRFAMAALACPAVAQISKYCNDADAPISVGVATMAYRIADAMMEARKVRPLNDVIVNDKFVEYRSKGDPQQ